MSENQLPQTNPDSVFRIAIGDSRSGYIFSFLPVSLPPTIADSEVSLVEKDLTIEMTSIRVVGKHARVVDTDSFTVDEWSGLGVTNEERVSVAQCRVSAGTAEPWRTSQFDEIFCILKGTYEFEHSDGAVTRADAGSTALVEKDTRFRPRFPTDCLYVAVCLPAFRPELSAREGGESEGGESAAAKTEAETGELSTDSPSADGAPALPAARLPEVQSPEVLYHMCPVSEWEEAKKNGVYYPASYEADDHFTHATGVASRLILTANNFYQDSPGDWVRPARAH